VAFRAINRRVLSCTYKPQAAYAEPRNTMPIKAKMDEVAMGGKREPLYIEKRLLIRFVLAA